MTPDAEWQPAHKEGKKKDDEQYKKLMEEL